MEEQGRIQPGTGKPKIFVSSKLVDLDDDGNEFNFLVKEAENLRWEETKTDLGIEQKPTWVKQPNHAIDALSTCSRRYTSRSAPHRCRRPSLAW
jgi:hypothetical protein